MECNITANKAGCSCTYEPCSCKGKCCECIAYHLDNKELLTDLSAEMRKRYS